MRRACHPRLRGRRPRGTQLWRRLRRNQCDGGGRARARRPDTPSSRSAQARARRRGASSRRPLPPSPRRGEALPLLSGAATATGAGVAPTPGSGGGGAAPASILSLKIEQRQIQRRQETRLDPTTGAPAAARMDDELLREGRPTQRASSRLGSLTGAAPHRVAAITHQRNKAAAAKEHGRALPIAHYPVMPVQLSTSIVGRGGRTARCGRARLLGSLNHHRHVISSPPPPPP